MTEQENQYNLHFQAVKPSILDVKEDKRKEIFNWGKDNAYPSLVEALVDMSTTASNCVRRASKAVYGKGFMQFGDVVINQYGQTLNEIARLTSLEFTKQNNFFIHISYDANFDISGINLIPSTDVRIGKADSNDYSGKFLIYDNWDHSKQRNIQLSKSIKVNRFNPSKEVVEKQIRQDAKDYFQEYRTSAQKKINVQNEKIEDLIQYYKGQILHVKGDTHYKYALSDVKMIENDCLFEYNSQVFRRNGAINGFLNTKILVTPPSKDEEARKAFKKNIEKTKGAVNAGSLQWFEMAKMPEDITKAIAVMDLTGEPNDKIFEYSDKQAEKEICKAFNVPLMLVSQTDNSLFGSSGEMLREAKIQLWEIKEEERQLIENTFSKLMNLFASDKKVDEKLTIENPLINIQNQ